LDYDIRVYGFGQPSVRKSPTASVGAALMVSKRGQRRLVGIKGEMMLQLSLKTVFHRAYFIGFMLMASIALNQESTEEFPKGVGPIESIELSEEIDAELATTGQGIFEQFCSACHKLEERYVGPAILGVTTRRAPEWIMNMILNPEVMIQEDDTAYELFAEYMTPMANQNMSEEQARALLEYFRSLDAAQLEEEDAEDEGSQ
jgi:mono/diheme cytochrome c family protein